MPFTATAVHTLPTIISTRFKTTQATGPRREGCGSGSGGAAAGGGVASMLLLGSMARSVPNLASGAKPSLSEAGQREIRLPEAPPFANIPPGRPMERGGGRHLEDLLPRPVTF